MLLSGILFWFAISGLIGTIAWGNTVFMRKLGLALLFFGFFWLALDQLSTVFPGDIWFTANDNLESLYKTHPECNPAKACYSADEIERYTANVVSSTYKVQPLYIKPGVLMFLGGLFLAFSSRKAKSNADMATEQATDTSTRKKRGVSYYLMLVFLALVAGIFFFIGYLYIDSLTMTNAEKKAIQNRFKKVDACVEERVSPKDARNSEVLNKIKEECMREH